MRSPQIITSRLSASASIMAAVALAACGGGGAGMGAGAGAGVADPQMSGGYIDTPLVTDKQEVVATATVIDSNLQNPWGIAIAPGLPFWIADNNSNVATLYSGTGAIETDEATGSDDVGVAIPASAAAVQANPTGQVYNGNGGFLVQTKSGPESALFMYDGEGGTVAAWAQDSGASAVTVYDDGVTNGADHAVYKGLALGTVNGAQYLYATDLHNGKIDVFDTNFSKPLAMQGKFIDAGIPSGFVPFGIAAVSGQLYVTYAMRDAAKHDEIPGAGLGYVDIFDFNGSLVSRFASAGVLNAPWGIAVAPAGFGSYSGDVLIGNFGDGKINVFAANASSLARSVGPLTAGNGQPLMVPGLWSLVFGNGDSDKPRTTLFYTAGFADQTDGVFGGITFSNSGTMASPY